MTTLGFAAMVAGFVIIYWALGGKLASAIKPANQRGPTA